MLCGNKALGDVLKLEQLRRAYEKHCRCSRALSFRVLALVLSRHHPASSARGELGHFPVAMEIH